MSQIHPTACVESGAELGEGVCIGPHSYVGAKAVIGDGCRLHNGVTVAGKTKLGRGNELFPGVVLGMPPQDLKYAGGETELVIGEDNVFREHVTIHPGTELGGGLTKIGNHNRLLVGTHIAHDVTVGDNCIMSNAVQVAGHCYIEDCVTMGGMAGLHNFCTVGRHCLVGGLARVTVDVPPFTIFAGEPARVRGINSIGMSRWGFDQGSVSELRRVCKLLFSRRATLEGAHLLEKIAHLESNGPLDDNLQHFLSFIKRSMVEGVHGRYRESLRPDSPKDRSTFF
jgi:UDP-N-acetylglucosamine acyltransferase